MNVISFCLPLCLSIRLNLIFSLISSDQKWNQVTLMIMPTWWMIILIIRISDNDVDDDGHDDGDDDGYDLDEDEDQC